MKNISSLRYTSPQKWLLNGLWSPKLGKAARFVACSPPLLFTHGELGVYCPEGF
jgi:hypothetical protein